MAKQTNEPPQIRNTCVKVYLTADDAHLLANFSKSLGMSRSAFIGAIMERLIIGGFSGRVAAQLIAQIQKRAKATGADADAGFYFGIRPLPALPVEDLAPADLKPVLAEIETLQPC